MSKSRKNRTKTRIPYQSELNLLTDIIREQNKGMLLEIAKWKKVPDCNVFLQTQ